MRSTKRFGRRGIGRLAAAGLLLLVLQACSQQAGQDAGASSTTRAGFTVWSEPRPVPAVQFIDDDGRPRSLADFNGEVVLLNVWATWCGPCREEMPTLDRLQQQLGSADFEVVALSVDQAGEQVVRDFYREVGVQHLGLYIDSSAQAAIDLNAIGLPTTLLLDRQGREVGRKLGAAEWDSPEVVEYLREVIAQSLGAE
jgi:thiol-disulfide isomerase/thioredoxin